MTDGADNRDDGLSYEEIIQMAKDKDIRVLTIGLGSDKDLNPEYYNEVYYFRFNTYDYIQNNNDKLLLFLNRILFQILFYYFHFLGVLVELYMMYSLFL